MGHSIKGGQICADPEKTSAIVSNYTKLLSAAQTTLLDYHQIFFNSVAYLVQTWSVIDSVEKTLYIFFIYKAGYTTWDLEILFYPRNLFIIFATRELLYTSIIIASLEYFFKVFLAASSLLGLASAAADLS